MKFGKLFKKLIAKYPEFSNLSANRCSLLTYKELRAIGKVLYPTNKEILKKYFSMNKEDLAKNIYLAMSRL